ncbi:MAG: hypothetical protein KU28_00280 [Sulfurovum sp. PC08-66]|nr:MAG: hypothetical protein KU28_00280 [Sulfurovum sp. PC08-66]KIM12407.1 MAG: hypothetical protein KU37_00400 [Sulfuricurvum sp. PC08-66]
MHTRQLKLNAFVLAPATPTELHDFLTKNAPLLADTLLLFATPLTPESRVLLEGHGLHYCESMNIEKLPSTTTKVQLPQPKAQARLIDKSIRSGERIMHEGDLVINANINDGAWVYAKGSLTLLGSIEGDVECDGAYMILSPSKRGKIRFQGQFIQDKLTFSGLQFVQFDEGQLSIRKMDEADHYRKTR